ncbi:cytochrome c oxidase subunit II [Alteribacter natronophilus]|uniref:cytochrome c oxidase subunit II n=1 Tax=Alteribacter natronophilus TaxID=2583810 RepID=UPI00110F04FD|nr:cytochrome c oxidase subunit II [Alteribacter natronophilus]TMW73087.1 cytochrome c oxidase subunit II [Alteribacter natronophilus]
MKNLWRVLPFSLILLLLAGCGKQNLTALDPRGPVAEMQYSLIILSLLIMIFVIVVVAAIYIYVLIRFREKPGDNHIPKQVEGNKNLEIIWTAIPIVLLLILAVPNVMDTFTLAETEPDEDSLVIEVTGHQFWWEFEYPDLGITAGQDVYIPTDTRIIFDLEASDVIHSFWVPALAGKQDNVPGITNSLWLEAPEEGVYQGKCTELCGESHWLMDFKVIAVDPDTFEAWAQGMAEPEAELSEPTGDVAAEGREVYEENCLSCHAVGGEGGNPQGGPDLTNFAEREVIAGFIEWDAEDGDALENWIREPQDYKPGNNMPAFGHEAIDEDEMDSLLEYLDTLRVLDSE